MAVTAHSMKGDRERWLAAGMDNYVTKPFDANRLIEVVESAARLHCCRMLLLRSWGRA